VVLEDGVVRKRGVWEWRVGRVLLDEVGTKCEALSLSSCWGCGVELEVCCSSKSLHRGSRSGGMEEEGRGMDGLLQWWEIDL